MAIAPKWHSDITRQANQFKLWSHSHIFQGYPLDPVREGVYQSSELCGEIITSYRLKAPNLTRL